MNQNQITEKNKVINPRIKKVLFNVFIYVYIVIMCTCFDLSEKQGNNFTNFFKGILNLFDSIIPDTLLAYPSLIKYSVVFLPVLLVYVCWECTRKHSYQKERNAAS